MAITLPEEKTKLLLASIKRYVNENFDQDIGELKASMLLDYVMKEIGPLVYNKAIADAEEYMQGRVADLNGVCYEKEFTYWNEDSVRRKRG